jgi:L-seryl-tRNA(Ser) seleniumtransferase
MTDAQFRSLPSVDRLVTSMLEVDASLPRNVATAGARTAIDESRNAISAGGAASQHAELVARAVELAASASSPSLVPVINATGVLLHTNLGRAPLSERAIAAMAEVSRGYSNLEFELGEGRRGSRHEHARSLLKQVTGAEDALVVNNNAAALFMALSVLAAGKQVIVSRGQAVEIGGGFRIPDVVRQSGAEIVEVGTTNRTHERDYAAAMAEPTAAILRVHASNFRVIGFTTSPPLSALARIAHERGALLLDDLGSGALLDTAQFGMAHEPMVQESLADGADLVLFSGDKLLGGPQCGILAGRSELVAQLRSHPLARALRVDKLTFAALNATLLSYAAGRQLDEIPLWAMISMRAANVRRRAMRWAKAAGEHGSIRKSVSMVGGGSLPDEGVPTWVAAIRSPHGPDWLASHLRQHRPPIVARIQDGEVMLDPRTVNLSDDTVVRDALTAGLAGPDPIPEPMGQ